MLLVVTNIIIFNSMNYVSILLYFGIGFVSGVSSGLFGIGGGSVRIPLLNFIGIDLINAFAINIFVIPFSSLIGTFKHKIHIVKWVVKPMIIGGVIGSVIGAFLVNYVPHEILAFVFLLDTLLVIIGMNFDKLLPSIYKNIKPTTKNIALGTFIINVFTGIRGGSGGSLFTPFLKMMGLSTHKAIATALLTTTFTAIVAGIVYWGHGRLETLPWLFVLIGSIVGVVIGSKLSLKTKPKWLDYGLTVLVVLLALLVLYKTL